MLASRLGRSRVVWLFVVIAIAIGLRALLGGGDDSSIATDDASATADAHARATSGAWGLSVALDRARHVTLATFSITRGALRLEGIARTVGHDPVAGARVTLGDSARVAISEADGTFFFDDLAEGEYALRAEQGDLYGEQLSAKLTDSSDPAEIEMRRGPTLDVLVIDASGAPIAHAHVESDDREANTDAGGHAQLRAVDTDSVVLTASAPGFAPHHEWMHETIAPGEPFVVTVTLQRGSHLAGTVVDPSGALVAGASVELRDKPRERRELLTTDEHGAWALDDVGSGTYVVSASSDVHIATAPLEFEHDGNVAQTGIVIRVEVGAKVHGVVVDAAGKPVAEATVSASHLHATTDEHGAYVLTGLPDGTHDLYAYTDQGASASEKITIEHGADLERRLVIHASNISGVVVDPLGHPVPDVHVRGESGGPNGGGGDITDEFGHFTLTGLPPGDYTLSAEHDDAESHGDESLLRVHSGTANVRLVLPDLAAFRGRVVLDGQPVPYFGFQIVYDNEHFQSTSEVREPTGVFHLGGLRPSTRSLVIVGPTFVTRRIDQVVLTAGKTLDLGDIVVERGRTVHGHVIDGNHAPVVGAMVSIRAANTSVGSDPLDVRSEGHYLARTDAHGAFKISGIAADADAGKDSDGEPLGLVIDATTLAGISLEQPLPPDATEIDLVLLATGTIIGHVPVSIAVHASILAWKVGGDEDAHATWGNVDNDTGAFTIEGLVVGEYSLQLQGAYTAPPLRVQVVADHAVTVAFPEQPQTATVHVHWPGCAYLMLEPVDSEDHLAGVPCDDHDVADFDSIAPGAYRVCDDTCTQIDVPALPEVSFEGP